MSFVFSIFSKQRLSLVHTHAGAAIPAEAVQPPKPRVDFTASRIQSHHRGAGKSKLKPAGHSARAQTVRPQAGKSVGLCYRITKTYKYYLDPCLRRLLKIRLMHQLD